MNCQALPHLIPLLAGTVLLAACTGSLRLDHREVPSRLKESLSANSRHPTAQEQQGDRLRLRITITHDGAVSLPMSVRGGMPLVQGRLGATPAWFLVDTGSQACVLEARTAVTHKVTVLDANSIGTTLEGTTGREQALVGMPEELAIGTWVLRRFPFLVRTHESHVRIGWWERHNIGRDIIGMNALRRSCDHLTLDFPAGQMVFGIGRHFTPTKGRTVWKAPLVMRDGLPHVQFETGGTKWLALVDSGFNGLLDMDRATASRLKLLSQARPSNALRVGLGAPVNGEPQHYGAVMLPRLDGLGPRLVNIPTLIVPRRTKIGCALLRPFRVTLDFHRGLLWLEDTAKTRMTAE